jgi:methyl-accepting chemotaxis protein
MQSFAEETLILAEKSGFIKDICLNPGNEIYELSKQIDNIRIEMLTDNKHLSEADMIEVYIVDHLLWRWRIYSMLLGFEKVNIYVASDHKNCRLGKLYYRVSNSIT